MKSSLETIGFTLLILSVQYLVLVGVYAAGVHTGLSAQVDGDMERNWSIGFADGKATCNLPEPYGIDQ